MSEASIQRLLPRHFKIIELALAGHEVKTIADTLGLTAGTVSMVLRSPLVQAELSRQRETNRESEVLGLDRAATIGKARSILEQASEKAAKVHENLLDSIDPTVQLRAADKILDRVFGKGDDARASVVNITSEHVQLLVLALKESQNDVVPAAHSPSAQAPNHEQGDVLAASEV